MKSSSIIRDISWSTFTCIFGWPVQGIWKATDIGKNINACMAMPDLSDIVVCNGKNLLLFRYPAVVNGPLQQKFFGHSQATTNARFSYNKRFVCSLGGRDRTIIIWRHYCELVDDSDNLPDLDESGSSSSAKSDAEGAFSKSARGAAPDLKQADLNPPVTTGKAATSTSSASEVKPWKSAFLEPSVVQTQLGSSDVDIKLEWIHGYRSHDCRGNLLYSSAGAIVYHAAALPVVYSKASGRQYFLHGAHANEVCSICRHAGGQIFATGEVHRDPVVCIWDSKSMEILTKIEHSQSMGISLLAFNNKGNLLAYIGLDPNSTLYFCDWAKNLEIFQTPTDKSRILCMTFLHSNEQRKSLKASGQERDIIVTGGFHHLNFWWAQGPNIQSQRALWGKEKKSIISCVASVSPMVCVTGSTDGTLLIWKDFKLFSNMKSRYGGSYLHGGNAIEWISPIHGKVGEVREEKVIDINIYLRDYENAARFLIGDKAGNIGIWRLVKVGGNISDIETSPRNIPTNLLTRSKRNKGDFYTLILLKHLHLSALRPKPNGTEIQSLCERDGLILIGTNASEIYEVNESGFQIAAEVPIGATIMDPADELHSMKEAAGDANPPGKKLANPHLKIDSKRLNSGHSGGEIWGLAMHPFEKVFVTTGDDLLVKCWSLEDHQLLAYFRLKEKARAMDFHPLDAVEFCLVLASGSVWIFQTSLLLDPYGLKGSKARKSLTGQEVMHSYSVVPRTKSIPMAESANPLVQNAENMKVKVLKECPTSWSQVAKYSFDGSLLAVGSHDAKIYVYSVSVSDKYKYEFKFKLEGHSKFVTHLDFGVILRNEEGGRRQSFDPASNTITQWSVNPVDGTLQQHEDLPLDLSRDICIQSTDGAGNLFFWRMDGTRVASAAAVRDVWWATFTCPFGWSVQGIWPVDEAANYLCDFTAVARSRSFEVVPVLAVADNRGQVRIYNYPCASPGAADKCYSGHSQTINNLTFSADDDYCVTVGGMDRCVFVWKTDIEEELRERVTYQGSHPTGIDEKARAAQTALEVKLCEEFSSRRLLVSSSVPVDEFSGSIWGKAWRGAISEPTNWKEHDDIGIMDTIEEVVSSLNEYLVCKGELPMHIWSCASCTDTEVGTAGTT